MNERNLIICDREILYANRLSENISNCDHLAVKVYVCTNLKKVSEFSQDKPIHMFVVDESYSYEERNQIEAGQVFVLGRGKVVDLGKDECQVGKYQCADEIIREIFETYIDKTKEDVMRHMSKQQARLLAVYSPIHRLGKTTFAISFGKECSKKKKVLYLNMEEYAGMMDEGLNLGDLVYYMKQKNGNLGIRLQSVVRKMENLDIVMPIPVSQDLKEVSQNEWKMLLKEIVENSAYELVIIDMGESVQGLYSLLEQCDRIYLPVLDDEISQNKLKQYEENLRQLNMKKIERKTCRFVMPEQVEEYARIRAREEL